MSKNNNTIKLLLFNIQSLNQHIQDFEFEDLLNSTEIVLLTETWENTKSLILKSYKRISTAHRLKNKASGTIIFEKQCRKNVK